MFDAMMDQWGVLVTQKLKKDISTERLDDLVRIIDVYMAGLLVHTIIFKEQQRYRDLTSQFLNKMLRDIN